MIKHITVFNTENPLQKKTQKRFSFCPPHSSVCPWTLYGGNMKHFSRRMQINPSTLLKCPRAGRRLTASFTVLTLTSGLLVEGAQTQMQFPPRRSIKHHITTLWTGSAIMCHNLCHQSSCQCRSVLLWFVLFSAAAQGGKRVGSSIPGSSCPHVQVSLDKTRNDKASPDTCVAAVGE